MVDTTVKKKHQFLTEAFCALTAHATSSIVIETVRQLVAMKATQFTEERDD